MVGRLVDRRCDLEAGDERRVAFRLIAELRSDPLLPVPLVALAIVACGDETIERPEMIEPTGDRGSLVRQAQREHAGAVRRHLRDLERTVINEGDGIRAEGELV